MERSRPGSRLLGGGRFVCIGEHSAGCSCHGTWCRVDERLSRDAQGEGCECGTPPAWQPHTDELHPHWLPGRVSSAQGQVGRGENHLVKV